MIIRETYIDKILPYIDKPIIKILSGIRRSGKSTILKMLAKKLVDDFNVSKENIIELRYDSIKYINFTAIDMYNEIIENLSKDSKVYLFLDEVQEIENWERTLNTLL